MFPIIYVHSCFTAFPSHRYPIKTETLPRSDPLLKKLTVFPSRNLENLFNGPATVTAKIGTWRQRKEEQGQKKDEEGEMCVEE